MIQQKKLGLATIVAVMGIASAAMLPQTAAAGYLLDGSGDPVKTGYGACVKGSWPTPDKLEACGDVMEKPAEPMAMAADSDNDGVNDDMDKCPGTPAGATVDSDGCDIVENVTINLVEGEFGFDSATLTPAMEAALTDFADRVKASPGHESVSVVGYTDSTGPEAYNQILSEKRASSAAAYLEAQGIDNISISGGGESNPIADNSTREGRAENRRVEISTH